MYYSVLYFYITRIIKRHRIYIFSENSGTEYRFLVKLVVRFSEISGKLEILRVFLE